MESSLTHQGDPKPLYFRENQERFAAWNITLSAVNIAIEGKTGTAAGHGRRCSVRPCEGLKDADDDDIILFGDVDEIPGRELISKDMLLPAAWRMDTGCSRWTGFTRNGGE